MGAGGVIVPPRGYWEKMQAVCRKYDVLLVADEVINGFGRTGTMFACEHFGIEPDILVLSKQITSSYLPLAAVLITDAIYQAHRRQHRQDRHLRPRLHRQRPSGRDGGRRSRTSRSSRSATSSSMPRRWASPSCSEACASFADHPLVGEVRGVGLIAAVELVADKATKAPFDRSPAPVCTSPRACHDHGLIVRADRRHHRLLPTADDQ